MIHNEYKIKKIVSLTKKSTKSTQQTKQVIITTAELLVFQLLYVPISFKAMVYSRKKRMLASQLSRTPICLMTKVQFQEEEEQQALAPWFCQQGQLGL